METCERWGERKSQEPFFREGEVGEVGDLPLRFFFPDQLSNFGA